VEYIPTIAGSIRSLERSTTPVLWDTSPLTHVSSGARGAFYSLRPHTTLSPTSLVGEPLAMLLRVALLEVDFANPLEFVVILLKSTHRVRFELAPVAW